MSKNRQLRQPSTKEALTIMGLVILAILISLRISLALVPALIFGSIVATLGAFYLGGKWEEIQEGIIDGIRNGLGAILILMIIGTVIGTWILGGTIQTLIYYGLKILKPQIFLPAGFILCSIISILIGSSFGTIATMGIVLMGVSEGLGVPPAMTAGVVVAGSLFGDKISPMSDSTNLTAAMTRTPLFSHIKSMLYVSGPAVIISLVIYYFLGKANIAQTVDLTTVEELLTTLDANFNISLLTLAPAVVVIALLAMKMPALIALTISALSAAIFAMITQGVGLADVVNVMASGYKPDIGLEMLDNLLAQGGVSSMMETVSIIMMGTAMGGILEKFGVLQALLDSLMKRIKKPRDLILASMVGGYLMLLATGEMMVSIIVPGRTLEPAYRRMNINTNVLSRSLETSATLACGVLPWGVAAVYARGVLGVGFEYVKYCYLPFFAPIIAIVFAFIGFATFSSDEEEKLQEDVIIQHE
ncbi:MAG: Na+/H+ antiporter NhaC [Tissierella sp.]|uniref:Na+/H+ antiporter NhaC n=1 Tax=Tissierella sp. TaxID=41274 RepID=UPI003F96D63B